MSHAVAVTTSVATPVETDSVAVSASAIKAARAALLEEVEPADVGDHLGHLAEDERVVTHFFACDRKGYAGWRWAVTVTRAYRLRHITIDEVVLLPGADAIVAPEWVPYRERIQPGDLSPGDLLPVADDDPRLVPTYSGGDDRSTPTTRRRSAPSPRSSVWAGSRTLSIEGSDLAAQRWYDGDAGPEAPIAQSAPEPCTTCGFLLRIAGPLSETFGVCANGNANDDGRVVAFTTAAARTPRSG